MIRRGVVVENNDPELLGRIKVQILGDLEDVKVEDLPWVKPIETFIGGIDSGSYTPPSVGDAVFLLRETSVFDELLYFGSWNTKESIPVDVEDPDTRVMFKSPKGHTIYVDDHPGSEKFRIIDRLGQCVEFYCPANKKTKSRGKALASDGTAIKTDEEAGIRVTTVDGSKFELSSKDGITNINIDIKKGQVNLKAKKVKINKGGAKVLTDKVVGFCRYTGEKFIGSTDLEVS